jgi:hypothetical protein
MYYIAHVNGQRVWSDTWGWQGKNPVTLQFDRKQLFTYEETLERNLGVDSKWVKEQTNG